MKVFLEKQTTVYINGKEIILNSGALDLDENIAQILINSGYAKEMEEKKSKK